MAHPLVGGPLAAIRSFFKYAHRAGLLRDNPAADIPLPKIRIGEIRALSQDECGRLLKVVETNPSPFRKLRDRTIIVTFLLTGARLREIVQLDRADVDLHQSTIRLHRKGGEINSAASWYCKNRDQGLLKTEAQEEPG
jgi:site-specific recombinase XerD